MGELWKLLAHCNLHCSYFPAAEAAARNAVAWNPESREGRLLLLQSLAAQPGRMAEAASLARQELTEHPMDHRLWSLWASSELDAGQTRRAMEILETALRFQVSDTRLLKILYELYLEHGLAVQAIAVAEKLETKKEFEQAEVERLVRFLQDKSYLTESAGILQSHSVSKDLVARQAYLEGNTAGAESALREGLHANPMDGRVLLELGRLRQEKKDYIEAADLYHRATLIKEVEYHAWIALSRLSVEQGDYDSALVSANKAKNLRFSPELEAFLQQLQRLRRGD